MKRATVLIASVLLAANSFPVSAADAPAAKLVPKDIPPAAISEMVDLYTSFCLNAFPDRAAIERLAAAKAATALTREQNAAYVNENPARGWSFRTPNALYALTIVDAPDASCTLRRITPGGITTIEPYLAAQQAYAARKKGTLVKAGLQSAAPRQTNARNRSRSRQQTQLSSGPRTTAVQYLMYPAEGKGEAESLILFFVSYNYHIPPDWRAEVEGYPGVEVRMVHQLSGAAPS